MFSSMKASSHNLQKIYKQLKIRTKHSKHPFSVAAELRKMTQKASFTVLHLPANGYLKAADLLNTIS